MQLILNSSYSYNFWKGDLVYIKKKNVTIHTDFVSVQQIFREPPLQKEIQLILLLSNTQ